MGFVTDTLTGPWAGAESDWRPGLTRRMAPIACCPSCGAADVHHKGGRDATSALVYWQCASCDNRWKSTERRAGRANRLL